MMLFTDCSARNSASLANESNFEKQEICLQAQGADALFKTEIIQALGLTATEQIKLANLRQEAERQTSALYSGRGMWRRNGQDRPVVEATLRLRRFELGRELRSGNIPHA